jgi:hypothetical protein
MKTLKRVEGNEIKTPKHVEGNEMPSRPMNAEPPQPAGGGKASSLQEGEMPTRAMVDEPEPTIPPTALSLREQDKVAAHRRDQAARAAAGKDEMPTGT